MVNFQPTCKACTTIGQRVTGQPLAGAHADTSSRLDHVTWGSSGQMARLQSLCDARRPDVLRDIAQQHAVLPWTVQAQDAQRQLALTVALNLLLWYLAKHALRRAQHWAANEQHSALHIWLTKPLPSFHASMQVTTVELRYNVFVGSVKIRTL